jgi:hypothetical protein
MSPSSIALIGRAERQLLQVLRALAWWNYGGASRIWLPNMRATAFTDGFSCVDRQLALIDARLHLRHPSVRSLGALLEIGQRFERSEPRDGIYALLGMVHKELPAASIHIDYSIPLGRLLEILTRHVLAEREPGYYGGLNVLLRVTHRKGDINARETASWAFRADRAWLSTQDPADFMNIYNASKGLAVRSEVTDSRCAPSALILEGFAVGFTIDTILPLWEQNVRDWICWLRDACRWFERKTRDDHGKIDSVRVLAQVLCDIAYPGVSPEYDFSHDEALSQGIVVIDQCRSWAGSTNIMDDVVGQEHIVESALSSFSYQLLGRVQHRRLFVTRDKRLGLGPKVMQTGDIVAILAGVMMPVILRRCDGGQFLFIGAAYVHGLMEGEAVETRKAFSGKIRTFELV